MANASQLPTNLNLFIATPGAIHAHGQSSIKPLFECAADGIVNACPANDNSGLLAVADSQLVILHDAARRTDRKYRLKSREVRRTVVVLHVGTDPGQGEPRLLLFSPDSRILYFSTTLSTAIQAYDVPTFGLLPPPQMHPSPPNMLAISPDGNILLSASPYPPTIYVQDLRVATGACENFQPVDLHPSAVFAAFRVEARAIVECPASFVIGFQDGTLSLFKMIKSVRRASHRDVSVNSFSTPYRPVRVASIRKLHKTAMGGITAAEFLPGYWSRVVSIGHDGRCRLVDFEGSGRVLRTWHVSGPATCLAVTSSKPVKSRFRSGGVTFLGEDWPIDDHMNEEAQTRIAVGTQAGKVMIFNMLGLLAYELDMHAPIVAIAWIGDMSMPSFLPSRRSSFSPGPTHEEHHHTTTATVLDSVLEAYEETAQSEDTGTVRKTTPLTRNMPSPVRLDGAKDLFCPSPPPLLSILRRPSVIAHDAAAQTPQPDRNNNRRRKSFLRPRIVTETFNAPGSSRPTSPQRSLLPHPIQRVASPAQEDQLRRTSQEVYDVFFADALRAGRTPSPASSDSASVYSQSSQSEHFVTPPASRIPETSMGSWLNNALPPALDNTTGPANPPRSCERTRFVDTGAGGDGGDSTSRRTNVPPFVRRGSPKTAEDPTARPSDTHTAREAFQASRAERHPFSAPPGQRPRRSINFEPKLDDHAEESRSEDRHSRLRQRPSRAHITGPLTLPDSGGTVESSRIADDNVLARQRHSVEHDPDREHEHEALRQEMAMLREEFRALRDAVLEGQRRERRA